MDAVKWGMAYKDPLDPRAQASRRKHYHANKEQYYRRNREQRARLRTILEERKNVPCMDCGESYPSYVMDFDHRDPSEKEMNVGQIALYGNLKKLLAEIDKCDIVCSNCHRERTHGGRSSA